MTEYVSSLNRIVFKNDDLIFDLDKMEIKQFDKNDYVISKTDITYYPLEKSLIKRWVRSNELFKKIMKKGMFKLFFGLVQDILLNKKKKYYIIINSQSIQIYNLIRGIFEDFYDELIIKDRQVYRNHAPLRNGLFKIGEINNKEDLVLFHHIYRSENTSLILYNLLEDVPIHKLKLIPACKFLNMKKKSAVIPYNIGEIRNVLISVMLNLGMS